MGEFDKSYGAFKLPPRPSVNKNIQQSSQPGARQFQKGAGSEISLQDNTYYEIEYDATPMPGVGKFVQKTQKIEAPEKDEIRELFARMRDIARSSRVLVFGNSKFYNKSVQQENSRIFYKQGMFMKDFEDDYEETALYTEYYPYYQMMGYRQLRTYFTWRTRVRKGDVRETSLSYAYLYLYELLSNIGVTDPQDGLDKLLFFWREFREYDPSIDKHFFQWLKDYHIYYDLPQPFSEFVKEKNLGEYYPEMVSSEDRFGIFCSLSKYDIRKSGFYGEGGEALIEDCFNFTMERLITVLGEKGIEFEDLIFLTAKSMAVWMPFQEALFFPWREQRDRQVAISAKEVYMCSQNQWFYRTSITAESGRQLVAYILKQMEAVLRRIVNYKYKITAGMGALSPTTVRRLEDAGISLEQCITSAVTEFYREATKTVVRVDSEALAKIRREALETQEKLLVPEDEEVSLRPPLATQEKPAEPINTDLQAEAQTMSEGHELRKEEDFSSAAPVHAATTTQEINIWDEFKQALSETELEALQLIIQGEVDIKQFADSHGIMLEVLADGINEKAVDAVGDSILDDELMIYDDYFEQVSQMLNLCNSSTMQK